MKKRNGWTLIELLVTITICIAIPLAIGLIWVGWHFISKYW